MILKKRQRYDDARSGSRTRLVHPIHVLVAGGGLGGLGAALILAERGAKVTVVERKPYLGGRVGAWTDTLASGESFEMERGFHAFFRQYYNLRAFLRRIDATLDNLLALEDYPLLGPGGARESFEGLPLTPPLNVMALVHQSPRLAYRDLPRIAPGTALEMFAYERERTYRDWDHTSAASYLDSLNFPPQARQMLFSVFAHSFFNPEETMSAADLLMMFHFYFLGNREGLVFDVLKEPFSLALWEPMRRYLEARGVTFRMAETVREVVPLADGDWELRLLGDAEGLRGQGVVLALEAPALKTLVAASEGLDDSAWRRQVNSLDVTLPFAVWRIWLDRPVRPARAPFAGTTGLGLVDNISVYERFEGESRRWSLREGGSIVEIHAYAVPEDETGESIRADFLDQLHHLYPETRDAKILEERFLLEQDCPSFAMGSAADRPGVATPFRNLALAGDALKLPMPTALMEKAVTSGFMAANLLLAPHDVQAEPIWGVPDRGILAAFKR